ncbi:MAG: hypothetical protein ACYCRD_05995 [Leptospirillum sp.]
MNEHSREHEAILTAKERGRNALLDPLPDLTHHGVDRWKENVKEYFLAECEDILGREKDPELREKVLDAMKEGFSELIESQHDVPIPESAVEEAQDAKEQAFRKIHSS